MARPREFDQDTVIDAAVDVFWAHGYDGASMPDLLQGMGLTRGSLYKAFHDKRTLFIIALEAYDKRAVETAVAILEDDSVPNGFDRIAAIFEGIVLAVQGGDSRGCLMCTAAAGAACEDDVIAEAVHALLHKMEAGFQTALQSVDWVSSTARPGIAQALLAQYVGLRTLSRAQVDSAALDQGVKAVLGLLQKPV